MASRTADLPLTAGATLVVLAGGASRRMGRPKHALPVAGVTLLEWIVARLGPSFAETIVSGAPAPAKARAVADRRRDAGPLAGIEAALLEIGAGRAFVLSVDMPYTSARLAAALLARLETHEAVVPRAAGALQPTCAVYAPAAAEKIGAYLDSGGRRASGTLERLDLVIVEERELVDSGIAAAELRDLDTPADYDEFLASLRT